ncbi:MAG TPA: acyl-[ACP]--phospholipid O-acyltransferase, partial [Candidatus Binatia bacterium]
TLRYGGFKPFLLTQFLGALNDNIFKMVVSLLAVNLAVGTGNGSGYLSIVAAVFILPFVLFSGYAGHVADVYSKRDVLVVTKAFEIAAMALGLLAFAYGRIEPMIAVVFLMALQSTFFSPAKYGILPEMLPDRELSRANGLLEMSTFLAIILGTSIGSAIMAAWNDRLVFIGLMLVAIAVVGTAVSFWIITVPPSGAHKPFRLNPWSQIGSGVKELAKDRTLGFSVLGLTYFWFLGALLHLAIILMSKEVMGLDDLHVGMLAAFLAVGIGVGSLAAGYLSGDKVELGLVPLGAAGMGGCSLLLLWSLPAYSWVGSSLVFLGFFGGLFIVPLYALVQQRSPKEGKGQLIATANFMGTVGILVASAMFWVLRDLMEVPVRQILLLFGLITLGATAYILTILPDFLVRVVLWMLTHTLYRIRMLGQEHVPFRGPALLVSNHVSYMDAIFIGACVQRFIRFMILRSYYEIRGLQWFFRLMKAVPISGQGRREIFDAFQRAREELRQGHVVCIFAEGSISRTGNLLPFKRGLEKVVEGLDVPVIPVHLDGVWGSIFSFKQGRFFNKWPERLPYPVTVSFGRPMPSSTRADAVRRAVMELGSEAVARRRSHRDLLQLRFVKTAKRRWFRDAMADSSGRRLTFGQLLIGGLLLSGWIRKRRRREPMIGLVLPSSVAGALANVAVLLAGRVPVNLNFTAGHEAMKAAVEQCGIRTVLTSRLLLSRAKLEAMEGMVYLEDVMQEFSPLKKAAVAAAAFALPTSLLQGLSVFGDRDPHGLAGVIFSSGSTGVPKGVMLSHHNVISNVEAVGQVFGLTARDCILGILPLFHSFGFTVTLWLPLLSGLKVVYHPNPADAAAIGDLVSGHKTTVLISTPTFCAMYMRRCTPEQFSSLRIAVVGAENLPQPTAAAFREKYGLELLEGYGCTEMGPVVSVNIPDYVEGPVRQVGLKRGTVGHPIPGVCVKVVDPATGAELQREREGLLLVKGPSRMMGYLGRPKETSEVLRNDWYVTGDMAKLDEEGFISITGRLSRFSKIAGEMVPHIKVEEAVNQILGDSCAVVCAVPDEQRGERLVVLYTSKDMSPRQLWDRLRNAHLPRLWIPKEESLFCVDAIPLLGSGKFDLASIKKLAHELLTAARGATS